MAYEVSRVASFLTVFLEISSTQKKENLAWPFFLQKKTRKKTEISHTLLESMHFVRFSFWDTCARFFRVLGVSQDR